MTHQYYFWVDSSEASSIKFYEKQTSKYNPFSNPQDNGFETSFKNVGNQKSNVIGVQQKKRDYLFQRKIDITAECLPRVINYQTDQVSSVKKDASE